MRTVTKVATCWAASSVTLFGPLIASAWTANRDARFYPSLLLVASAGAATGLSVRRGDTPAMVRLRRLPPALVVATAFPACILGAVVLGDSEGDVTLFNSLPLLAVALAIGSIGVLIRLRARDPGVAFHRAAYVWLALSVLLFPAYGAGLAFVPLAVSYRIAARTFRCRPAEL